MKYKQPKLDAEILLIQI